MEIQLQELIEKIKKEGIESASNDAARVKAGAEQEAGRIIEAARKEAAMIISRGKADAERSEKAGVAAIEQAARNLLLQLKDEIQGLLDKVVSKETAAAYNADTLKTIIPVIVQGWVKASGPADVVLAPTDYEKVETFFAEKLASQLKAGVEFKLGRNIEAGFHIAEKDGAAYYDFSAEAVAEFLSAYLNPRLAEILKKTAEGAKGK